MEDDDIYKNKRKYEGFIQIIKELVKKPEDRNVSLKRKRGRYYCKHTNLKGCKFWCNSKRNFGTITKFSSRT